jgi:hypothetical protein
MGIAFQDQGIIDAVNNLTAGALATAKLRLFQHGPSVTNATALGSLTEATFAGYTSVTLSGWSAAAASSHVASSTASPVTFTLTSGSQSIGGWYITDSGNTVLLVGGNDINDPISLNTTTNVYQVTVTVAAAS